VWNLIRGGTEGQCARVAMELARRGGTHQVSVFRREGYFLEKVEQVCGPVEDLGIRGFLRPGTALAVRRLARRLKRDRVKVLHAWDADAAIFGQFAAAMAGVPLITSRRDLGEIYPPHKVWLMRRADRKAAGIVANAEAIADAFAGPGLPREKFAVIPNIVDVPEFDEQAAGPFSMQDRLPEGQRVVMVSRLDPEKDIPTFLFAAELVLKAHPEAAFVVAGDGRERKSLETMAAHHGLEGRIVFPGDVTEVPALLRQCRVGVLTPSRNEGLSNTILEYMAAGLPVVATDCGGNRELVHPPDGGAIADTGDAESIAAAILSFLRDPASSQAAGKRNREVVEREFRPAMVADRFDEVYWTTVRK